MYAPIWSIHFTHYILRLHPEKAKISTSQYSYTLNSANIVGQAKLKFRNTHNTVYCGTKMHPLMFGNNTKTLNFSGLLHLNLG